MSNNPFDRNKTKEARLGELITEPGEQNQRDAIHIAVVPIIAESQLQPGEHIGVTSDGKYSATGRGSMGSVGIVDPFLRAPVQTGQTFWLFLYQGSVNTLRHEWTHPAFPNVASPGAPADLKAVSEVWLRAYAMRIKPYDSREDAYSNFLRDLEEGEIFFHGTDTEYEARNDSELMHHIYVVTGKKFGPDDLSLRCSC